MEKHVACIATGEHRGKSRFPTRHPSTNLKAWRCDLTALSHRHNLYFLASNTSLHIYQPGFPDQSLASEPDLILHPPVTGHGGPGIDGRDPHSINRVLVDYLGHEEIVIVACDDGDVMGYRTEMLHRALERQSRRLEPASEDDVPVFLRCNVGASAWGLAIHREARIIAISANTHQITIIAYALSDDDEELDIEYHNRERPRLSTQFPFLRQEETVFTLSAANNLPALSFYGNSGRWLLSSCVDGKTVLWDLHTKQEAATYQLGWCKNAKNLSKAPPYNSLGWGFTCSCPAASSVLHGAWGTLALDTRSAYHLPLAEEQNLGPEEVANRFWDVTTQKKRFTVEKRSSPIPYVESSESEDEFSDGEDDDEDEDVTHDQPQQLDYFQVDEFAQLEILQGILQGHQNLPDIPGLIASIAPQISARLPPSSAPLPYCAISKHQQPTSGNIYAEDNVQDPFIILTKEDVFLVQRPFTADNIQDRSDYIVSMRRPLHPGDLKAPLSSPDRHCFFAQIPELGVFVVGSPIGRAGVFSLYWTLDEDSPRRRYGFKLEYLLPFRQDDENEVAGVPQARGEGLMVGIAVAPVQGMFDGSCDHGQDMQRPRRWRVLMYYMDHTVLSFELSKPRVGVSPVLSELVV